VTTVERFVDKKKKNLKETLNTVLNNLRFKDFPKIRERDSENPKIIDKISRERRPGTREKL